MEPAVIAQASSSADVVITWQSLATAAGASVVALILVQFLKIFIAMSDGASRKLSAILGVLLVLGAVLALDGLDWLELGLGVFVGVQAGLAASKSVEVVRHSFNHMITAPTEPKG